MSGRATGRDNTGWQRGAGHYSRDYAKFDSPQDGKAIRKLDSALFSEANTERTGPVSGGRAASLRANNFDAVRPAPGSRSASVKGGPPRYRPKSGPLTNGGN